MIMVKKEVYKAVATLVGTVIGAGILGIPYVIAQAGFFYGLLMLLLLSVAALGMNLAIGEVALRTKGNHQLTGYAEIYLGKYGKMFMALSMFLGIYGALTAYIVGVGEALFVIFGIWNPLVFSLMFFVFVSSVVYVGLELIERFEVGITSSLVVFMFAIVIVSLLSRDFSLAKLATLNLSKIPLTYGVILFAFLGAIAIPEVKEVLNKNKKDVKKAIIIGSMIPLLMYSFFAFAVVGVFGANTSEIATIGFGQAFGQYMVIVANFFAVFAMSGSFLALGLAMKELYNYDYKLSKTLSWALTVFVPLSIVLLGLRSFVKTLGFAGSIAGGIDGILIVMMFFKAKKMGQRKPEYDLGGFVIPSILLVIVFSLGIIYQILSVFGML